MSHLNIGALIVGFGPNKVSISTVKVKVRVRVNRMWGLAGAALVVLCATFAALGFKGRNSVVGIDLGTTYSVIGVKHPQTGNVHIISDPESDSPLIPSVVAYLEGGEVIVGEKARTLLDRRPLATVHSAKRFIGRTLEDVLACGKH